MGITDELEGKGEAAKRCNLTACQRPNSAVFFNKSTKKYYCYDCAAKINWRGGRKDTEQLYGTPYLCEVDQAALDLLNDGFYKRFIQRDISSKRLFGE